MLDLYDIRAEIAQNLARPRASQNAGEIKHTNMRKSACH